MCTTSSLIPALDALADEQVDTLSNQDLRAEMAELLVAVNRLNAELTRRVRAFDRRGLAIDDACHSTTGWLRTFGRLSAPAASACVKRARLSDRLPALAAAAADGDISPDHLDRVTRLADRVGVEIAAQADQVLADSARQLDPTNLGRLCERIVAHVDPDGVQPDAAADFARRGLSLSPFDGMVLVRGQLDPDGGAALAAALNALMGPPAAGELRSPAQRRADALVELARGALREGHLPTVGGVRPQVAVLIPAQRLAGQDQDTASDDTDSDSTDPDSTGPRDTRQSWIVDLAAPGWLEWVGDVPDVVARRIACDADVWRVLLDPATSQPVDVGRTHRVVPVWLRKALHARDRGCRFPGCHTPAAWTDGHHLRHWADGGPTNLANIVLLCRFHHGLVHEAGWTIDFDISHNIVTARRPDGTRYDTTIRGPADTSTAA
jgi:hypothetical protein